MFEAYFTAFAVITTCVSMTTIPSDSYKKLNPLGCQVKQYAQLGQHHVINCTDMLPNFDAIYWYNLSEHNTDKSPIAWYSSMNNKRLGTEYLKGTMDIALDGSLIIKQVNSHSDGLLKVVVISKNDGIISCYVHLVIAVTPKQLYPNIGTCENPVCYHHFSSISTPFACHVSTAKPPVTLSWRRRLLNENVLVISREELSENDNGTFDTFAFIDIEQQKHDLLALFICRSYWEPGSRYTEASILIEFSKNDKPHILKYVSLPIGSIGIVRCSETKPVITLWKRVEIDGGVEILGWNAFGTTMNNNQDQNITVSNDGNLVFNKLKRVHEAVYVCVYDDGIISRMESTTLVVLVLPDPPYPYIMNCIHGGNCTSIGNTRSLECSLSGVMPRTELRWAYNESLPINLKNHRKEVIFRENVFDITISVDYEIIRTPLCTEILVITCDAFDPVPTHFTPITHVTIHPDGPCEPQSEGGCLSHADAREQLQKGILLACLICMGVSLMLVGIYHWMSRKGVVDRLPVDEHNGENRQI